MKTQAFCTVFEECFTDRPSIDISEVTKSHPKGDDDIKFSID